MSLKASFTALSEARADSVDPDSQRIFSDAQAVRETFVGGDFFMPLESIELQNLLPVSAGESIQTCLQTSLLRRIERRRVPPFGGISIQHVDLRAISEVLPPDKPATAQYVRIDSF
jgi:hypothetical protein